MLMRYKGIVSGGIGFIIIKKQSSVKYYLSFSSV